MWVVDLFDFIKNPVLATSVSGLAAVLAVLLFLAAAVRFVRPLVAGHAYPRALLKDVVAPLRLLLPMLALQTVWAVAPPGYPGLPAWRHVTLLVIIGAATWLVVNALVGIRDVIMLRYPADVEDNLLARRILTQATVLMRTLSGLAILLGVSSALMTFPDVRQVGASLLASAGLAGLVVGFAAKPVLGNIIAGLQIAMAQPIRIDDVLIVEGEWGRVEEITGAYVVVKIWDERRLVVPLQWFIEHPFQNWTRNSAQIIGTVFLWTDYRLPLAPLRRELEQICRAAPEWDGRVCVLQVTDASEHAMQLRALVSSGDSGRNWDLRCRVREGLIAFVQREHAYALPRLRAELAPAASSHGETVAERGVEGWTASAKGKATPDVTHHRSASE
ncbi:MAG: mechanosensitive ion channel [Zoogloea sp.]|nr:mechanosensitive ion channel [Zoogloea sp.]